MGTGYLNDDILNWAMNEIADVEGDFAEVGVYRGALFNRLAGFARDRGIIAHAFDSFTGMAPPGPKDDSAQYPKGVMSVGGVEKFRKLLTVPDVCRLWPGYIPDCFKGAEALRFAFAWIDVDHYEPTKEAIRWVWPRVNAGGIIGFDDYFPRREVLASPAIQQFLEETHGSSTSTYFLDNNQLLIKKD